MAAQFTKHDPGSESSTIAVVVRSSTSQTKSRKNAISGSSETSSFRFICERRRSARSMTTARISAWTEARRCVPCLATQQSTTFLKSCTRRSIARCLAFIVVLTFIAGLPTLRTPTCKQRLDLGILFLILPPSTFRVAGVFSLTFQTLNPFPHFMSSTRLSGWLSLNVLVKYQRIGNPDNVVHLPALLPAEIGKRAP